MFHNRHLAEFEQNQTIIGVPRCRIMVRWVPNNKETNKLIVLVSQSLEALGV